MKKIVDGKKYDTETADLLKHEGGVPYKDGVSGEERECHHCLYRKKNGELFLVHYNHKLNGPIEKDSFYFDADLDDIKDAAESMLEVEEYEAIFGPVDE